MTAEAPVARDALRPRQGIIGALAVLAATLVVVATLPTAGVASYAILLVGVSAWVAPAALRRMAGWRVLAVLLALGAVSWLGSSLAAASGAAAGEPPAALALHIVLRVGVILLAVGLVACSVPPDQFAAGLERLGLRGFGFALGVAANSLPLALESLRRTWWAVRLRRPYARGRLHAMRLAATTVITHLLVSADDTVASAMARGYDPARRSTPPVVVTGLDLGLAAAAVAIIALCICRTVGLTP
ncbi:MAG TPA: energy-coupling factor transporter transmembrane component T [Armatimonadota bacterium]|nr:energy-coupling factor transporter transmembrane component T [Armatimonadota bacterium]